MKRLSMFVYGVVCYAASLATFLYAFGFLGNLWVSQSIDSARAVPLMTALPIDLALLGIFGLQHSVMARPAFKRWWTRIVPIPAERSAICCSRALRLSRCWRWQPIGVCGASAHRSASQALGAYGGLGGSALLDVPAQSLRPVRPAPGLATAIDKPYQSLPFQHPPCIIRAPPAVCRLAPYVLGRADADRCIWCSRSRPARTS
jgi:hypothetical protein